MNTNKHNKPFDPDREAELDAAEHAEISRISKEIDAEEAQKEEQKIAEELEQLREELKEKGMDKELEDLDYL